MAPEHGGKIATAAAKYDIAPDLWLDLSTGLSPLPYPVGDIPAEDWHRLPDDDSHLVEAAARYYGTADLIAVPGSQAAIQLLPRLRRKHSKVAIVHPTYNEHHYWWKGFGHSVSLIAHQDLLQAARQSDVVVVANPNNPDGRLYETNLLLQAHQSLSERDGWLIVDEAFVDTVPKYSLTSTASSLPGLFALRSVGKFFGLAGARVGFVAAATRHLSGLKELSGPWTVAGPSAHVCSRALLDAQFQLCAMSTLRKSSARLGLLLKEIGLELVGATDFFVTVYSAYAEEIQDALARNAILTRRFSEQSWLRFGLPGAEHEWRRLQLTLETALDALRSRCL